MAPEVAALSDVANNYLELRAKHVQDNQRRLAELGLLDLIQDLSKQRPRPKSRKVSRDSTDADQLLLTPAASRRSTRLQGLPTPSYRDLKEQEVDWGSEEAGGRRKRRRGAAAAAGVAGFGGPRPEAYTAEQQSKLGSCEAEWELFVDGCGADGKRVYDPVKGKTCHQCRQKTLGHRTFCSQCESLVGQFCGDCLFMRYGENVLEANANPAWVCPVCRDICNCSFCRTKKGWAPTGTLYRKVIALGYKSVAHFLLNTRTENSNSDAPKASSSTPPSSNITDTPNSPPLGTAHSKPLGTSQSTPLGDTKSSPSAPPEDAPSTPSLAEEPKRRQRQSKEVKAAPSKSMRRGAKSINNIVAANEQDDKLVGANPARRSLRTLHNRQYVDNV